MNALTAALKEELNVEMISIGGLQIPESVVVSWGIMAFLVICSILLTPEPPGRPHHQAAGHPGDRRDVHQRLLRGLAG